MKRIKPQALSISEEPPLSLTPLQQAFKEKFDTHLSADVAKRALRNMLRKDCKDFRKTTHLSDEYNLGGLHVARALRLAFSWEHSHEGYIYWRTEFDKFARDGSGPFGYRILPQIVPDILRRSARNVLFTTNEED